MTLVSNITDLRFPVENKSPGEIDKVLSKRDQDNYKSVTDLKIYNLLNNRKESIHNKREDLMGELASPALRKKYEKPELIKKIQTYEVI